MKESIQPIEPFTSPIVPKDLNSVHNQIDPKEMKLNPTTSTDISERQSRLQMSKIIQDQTAKFNTGRIVSTKSDNLSIGTDINNWASTDSFDYFYGTPLLNEDKLNKIISRDPWSMNIAAPLDEFLGHVKRSGSINFKVGGRILHSASNVVKVKSNVMVNDSSSIIDEFKAEEIEQDEQCAAFDSYNEDSIQEDYDLIESSFENDNQTISGEKGVNGLNKKRKAMSDDEWLSEVNSGNIILSAPGRCLYTKIELSDLSQSLDVVIRNRVLRERRKKKAENDTEDDPSKKGDPKNLILPTNFIKNKENARKIMEENIESLYSTLCEIYTGEPIPFYKLIDERTKDGVVHCILYLLHLGNRKKVTLYQKFYDPNEPDGSSKRRRSNSNEISAPVVEDIIYVVPCGTDSTGSNEVKQ